jgi:hypothetical protein
VLPTQPFSVAVFTRMLGADVGTRYHGERNTGGQLLRANAMMMTVC